MKTNVLASLRTFLDTTSQVDDLAETRPVARLADRSQVRPFRLRPETSLEALAPENPFATALLEYQNGSPAALQKLAAELEVHGIKMELRNFPDSPIVTGVVLVSSSFAAIDEILKPR